MQRPSRRFSYPHHGTARSGTFSVEAYYVTAVSLTSVSKRERSEAGGAALGSCAPAEHRPAPPWRGQRTSARTSPSSRPPPSVVRRRRASPPRQPPARQSPPLPGMSPEGPEPSGRGKTPPNRPLCATRQPGAVRVECRRVDVLGDQRAGLSMRWSSTFLDQGPDQPPIQALSPCQRARCSAAGGWCRFLESG